MLVQGKVANQQTAAGTGQEAEGGDACGCNEPHAAPVIGWREGFCGIHAMKVLRFVQLYKRFDLHTLLAVLLLQGCTGPVPWTAVDSAATDCRSLGGLYRDAGEPNGDSLVHFLLGKPPSKGRGVQIEVSAERLQISAGATEGALVAGKDFKCSGAGRITLTRQESSRIYLPPLIDQTKTVNYVFHVDAAANLVMSTYAQTSLAPYGMALQGPAQLESTIIWRRASP